MSSNNVLIKECKDVFLQISKLIETENKDYGKELLLLSSLRKNCTILGEVNITIDYLSQDCGYSITNHAKPMNTFIRNRLKYYCNLGYIETTEDVVTVPGNKLFTIKILNERDLFNNYSTGYIQFTIEDFNRITKSNTVSKKDVLLLTYLAIKQNIYHTGDYYSLLSYSKKDVLLKRVGIKTEATLRKAISDLLDLRMIYKADQMYYKNVRGAYSPCRNIYALRSEDLIHSKKILKEIYNTDDIYTLSEIDKNKIEFSKANKEE